MNSTVKMIEYSIPIGCWAYKRGIDIYKEEFDWSLDYSKIKLGWEEFEASELSHLGTMLEYQEIWWKLEAKGSTLNEIFQDINRRYPGTLKDLINLGTGRLKPGLGVFVNGEIVHSLDESIPNNATIYVAQAIAGG